MIIFHKCISTYYLIESCKALPIMAATDESQKTRNKKQETKRFSTFAVSRLRHSGTKKKCLAKQCFANQTVPVSINVFSSDM